MVVIDRKKSVPDWVVLSKGQTMLVRFQYGKVQMNAAQMLRVLWSKVTSIGDKLLQVLLVLGVFQRSILRDTTHTRSISGMITLNAACALESIDNCRVWYSEILLYPTSILGFIPPEYSLDLMKYSGALYYASFKYLEHLGHFVLRILQYSEYFISVSYSEVRLLLGVFRGFVLQRTQG